MAGWSTSYRWVGHPKGAWKTILRHDARDVEPGGKHSNPDIDPARTALNESWVPTGTGKLRRARSRAEVEASITARLEAAKPPTRRVVDKKTGEVRVVETARKKDATEVEEFLLQLDPVFTGTSAELAADPAKRAEVMRLQRVMVGQVVDLMGMENIHLIAFHWDETNPHVQVLTTPVTAEGRLAFKEFIPGGRAGWAKQHDEMRARLRAAGYDATMERVDGGRGHDHLTNFKRNRDAEKKLEAEREALAAREADLSAREGSLAVREQEVEQLAARAAEDADAAATARRAADAARRAADAARRAAEAREAELAVELARVESVPSEFDRWLDAKQSNGSTPRANFEGYQRRQRKFRAQVEASTGADRGGFPDRSRFSSPKGSTGSMGDYLGS